MMKFIKTLVRPDQEEDPERTVVAVVGDGGFLMSGFSLAAAVRERVPLTVLVFSDGSLGQIRDQLLTNYGHDFATSLGGLDFGAMAEAMGARYALLDGLDALERKYGLAKPPSKGRKR